MAYLGALAGRHPVLMAGPGSLASLTTAYDPDVVIGPGGVTERRARTTHDLHPDLALLLSTSGTTGSPKLVRLSHDNLVANATAIASDPTFDRAMSPQPRFRCTTATGCRS